MKYRYTLAAVRAGIWIKRETESIRSLSWKGFGNTRSKPLF
jgi:hypothetical protein